MVNMQMSAAEAKESQGCEVAPGDAPRYPYGLTVCLDDGSLKKLGLDSLPPVGSVLTLTAKVVVTSVGMNQQQDGDKEQRAELQITDMDLGGVQRNIANSLYGGA